MQTVEDSTGEALFRGPLGVYEETDSNSASLASASSRSPVSSTVRSVTTRRRMNQAGGDDAMPRPAKRASPVESSTVCIERKLLDLLNRPDSEAEEKRRAGGT